MTNLDAIFSQTQCNVRDIPQTLLREVGPSHRRRYEYCSALRCHTFCDTGDWRGGVGGGTRNCTSTLFLFQPRNAQTYITTLYLYIMFTPTCFDISVSSAGSFNNLLLAKLRMFLKLELLKLQFHNIIRLKYI